MKQNQQITVFNTHLIRFIILLTLAGVSSSVLAKDKANDPHYSDPHYSKAGFFDLHVCQWVNRKPFFKIVFSTFNFDDVDTVSITTPDNKKLLSLDMTGYIQFTSKGRKKRAFLRDHDLPEQIKSGWYTASILMKNEDIITAKDYVDIELLPIATNLFPKNNTEIGLPVTLSWTPIPGAKYYQVFVRDIWEERKLVFRSKLQKEAKITIPQGKLKADGEYEWLVHARDVNNDIRLGDFNAGSRTQYSTFTVKKE